MNHVIQKATLPSLAQQLGKPFNFIEFLNRPFEKVTLYEVGHMNQLAAAWPSCAVGNMCAIIPRGIGHRPYDALLYDLGCEFSSYTNQMAWAAFENKKDYYEVSRKNALRCFHKIECRASELIDEILDAKEKADKLTGQIPLLMNIQELKDICQPKTLTVAQEAKELLKNISKDDWIAGTWYSEGQRACAVGHYNRIKRGIQHSYPDEQLVPASEEFLANVSGYNISIITVNDGNSCGLRYTELHPKDRVMHLLDDMIKAGY